MRLGHLRLTLSALVPDSLGFWEPSRKLVCQYHTVGSNLGRIKVNAFAIDDGTHSMSRALTKILRSIIFLLFGVLISPSYAASAHCAVIILEDKTTCP